MAMKLLTCVTFLLSVDKCWTLFSGESCYASGVEGICHPLSECRPLLTEIRQHGTPLSLELRRKLATLGCGFSGKTPLVCCVTSNSEFDDDPRQNWGIDNLNSKPTHSPITNPWSGNDDRRGTTEGSASINPWANDQDTNRGGQSDQNSNGPKEVTRHRNLRLLPKDCGTIDSDRIIGGDRTALFEMPWMVLLEYETRRGMRQLNCGGTLITKWYVLTAAHCVSFLGGKKLVGVVIGEYDTSKDPDCDRNAGELVCAPSVRNVTIDTVIPHTGYNPQGLVDDIALIRMSEPADFSLTNLMPICLPVTPTLQNQNLVGQNATVAGWGTTEDGIQSPVLLKVDLPVISNQECQAYFNGHPRIYERQLCAGGLEAKDSCSGDSGGPLLFPGLIGYDYNYIQRGIVSFGSKKCGTEGYPGIYTNVAYYMEWILDNIRE